MPYHEFFWTERALEKLTDNGLSREEVEFAVEHADYDGFYRSSGRPVYAGPAPDGRRNLVVYAEIDAVLISVVTAFEI
jgi:hypothetical protein